MEPSNPTNGQPFIYRIMDALGITHQVVPVNHSHNYLAGQTVSLIINGTEIELEPSDIPNVLRAISDPDSVPTENSTKLVTSGGVKAALEGKQDALTFDTTPTANSTNPVTSGGVKTALDGKANISHTHTFIREETANESSSVGVSEGTVNIEVRNEGGGGECAITPSNIGNLFRALSDPDSTPTLNSNKLVTSGGVWVSIQERFQGIVPDVLPLGEGDSMRLDELGMTPPSVRRFIIENNSSSPVPFRDLFVSDSLPVHISGDETLEVGSHEYVMVSIFRENSSEHVHFNCYFVLFEGIFSE